MRSVLERRLAAAACAIALCVALPSRAADTQAAPSREQVRAAVARVAQDPDLPRRVTEKSLRFKQDDKPDPPRDPNMEWLSEFMRWISESARLLMWLLGAVAVAVLLVGLRRWARARAEAAAPRRHALPSHVQSLDIRPESLPDDIGQAAAALWSRGEHRPALSLLYRGALSRLVHEYALPIRAASTEGECVALAGQRLDSARAMFFARLVRAWQLAVYGARLPDADDALALCRDFALHLQTQRAGAAA